MIFQNEKQLLKIIRYVPTLFLISISLFILTFLYIENIKTFQTLKDQIQTGYVTKNKELIKERVYSTYNHIIRMQKNTENSLKKSLKEEMNKVYSIANSIYENNKNIKSNEEIKKLIKDAIRPIRFNNGRGYFFIHDKNQFANTMHPIMPKLEGKNSYNVKDAKGVYIIRQMHKLLKQKDETFYEWYWYKPKNKKTQYKKIGYIKNFKPFNWFIGTGEYVIDFEKEVQKKALEYISSSTYKQYGYTFVLKYDGTLLNHYDNKYIGKNVLEIVKIKDEVQKMIDVAKSGRGYITYYTINKPQNNTPSKKTSFIIGLDNWKWAIGTGFYEDDINSVINEKKQELDNNIFEHMKNTIIVSIVLAFILLLLSMYFAKIIKKKFKKYKDEIKEHLEDKVKQQDILAQQAKLASMGEMIANIAHQWRQPLSSISSNATSMLVQQEVNVLDNESIKKGLTGINIKAQYLSSTIDDFRNFLSQDTIPSNFYIKDTINKVLSIIGVTANQEINIITQIQNAKINSFENELIQVLINILNNSKDALEGIKNDKCIFITTVSSQNNLVIKIKDNAGGINKKIISKIFEPYFTTKHQFQGTGIGLYMSEQMITKHMKGTIEVSNTKFIYKDKKYLGAEFIIKLKKQV